MYKNKARCKKCDTMLESKHRHDFVTCDCGCLSLDGGLAYRRVLWRGGEYDEVVEHYLELVKPLDVQLTANISARERDIESEYYNNLYHMLLKEEEEGVDNEQGNDQRSCYDSSEREVSISAQN